MYSPLVELLSYYMLAILLLMARAFALWKDRKDQGLIVCLHTLPLVGFAGIACLSREQGVNAVFVVVCFIWIVVCVATSYALCESWRRLHDFFDGTNDKDFLAFMGTLAVAALGVVACMRLLQWISL